MHKIINNLVLIEKNLKEKLNNNNIPIIIAVSKTFPMSEILPLINHGHEHFGENKVQEALEKWTTIKDDFNHIKLHMIGGLQTNKVKYVIKLFDYIHSLDSLRLAEKISIEQKKIKKSLKIFIQINIGEEDQKSGIEIKNLENFYKICVKKLDLDIIGLMCLPPKNKDNTEYFSKMKELASKIGVKQLSMGMSADYIQASNLGSTFIRVGSNIFGERFKKF
ncbi:YggS family pyridoxal phosphate-dependent enzyme [Candidatus Pelagibacter sp. Uisw_113]|uniref:YggS family pyridoxal phosphate-dependent enzyme n=1 Tax=Candidatus Pelagibacter sp. Uisw_113 TaxID=3230994 RepID=UPI0039E883A7